MAVPLVAAAVADVEVLQAVAVGVGKTVSRGDTLAFVGSTGRSTGPHVHFEVLKDGRQIDPLTFIGR